MNSLCPSGRWRERMGARAVAVFVSALLSLAAGGCALSSLQPGASLAQTRQSLGLPSVEHRTADGGRRLLYRMGLQTYALEFDPQDRLLRSENVLDEAHFNRIGPGMTREQVREQLGQPTRVWAVRYRNQTVWSYSFDDLFCRQFHVGLTPDGKVDDTSYGPDPRCEDGASFRTERLRVRDCLETPFALSLSKRRECGPAPTGSVRTDACERTQHPQRPCSCINSATAAGSDDAGFWPVISLPSTTT